MKICLVALLLCWHWPLSVAETSPPRNIILILADDVGVETVTAYGGESYQTPELDRLASEGMRFTYAHAQPLCTPSRVKMMTGQHSFRNYRHFSYLDPKERTFAHVLKKAGYATAVAGKWQLLTPHYADVKGAMPADAGFEEYLLWQLERENKGSRYWGPVVNHNGVSREHDAAVFGPDLFNEYVLDYITRHTDQPFLIYYPMVLAHSPWVTTPDMRDKSADDQERFAAMIAYMDKMVGNIRRKVIEEGIAERTVILFIGDNGTGRDIISQFRGREVRGAKALTLNAGTRVPFLAWGPGLVEPGAVSSSLVNLNDIFPTLAAIAGVALAPDYTDDGKSLLPVLRRESELSRDSIFIHYEPFWPTGEPARYALDRQWKLYQDGAFFDTEADPLEQHPLETARLDSNAAAAHRRLLARIANMPGELQSPERWEPPRNYPQMAASIMAAVIFACLCWRVLVYVREPGAGTSS